MESIQFLDLNTVTVVTLFVVGFIGGLVSGFIGSGGAFVLTPAMMSLGVPGIIAVASNMAHKFPKALVGSIRRARFGQVDVRMGVIMGLFAEIGVFAGKEIMTHIRDVFGNTGTDLYVSAVFVVVLAIFGSFVLRDAIHEHREGVDDPEKRKITRIARWVQSVHIPGTMVYFRSIGKPISILFLVPLGFLTGLLAAAIAVGGFIGVPALIYIIGMPAIMATATELVVAFVMGMGGSMFYAWEGFVDIRLSMIILAGSLFGLQIGAIGTTYVKDYVVKFVMGMIMVIVLFSRLVALPVYLADLGWIDTLPEGLAGTLDSISFDILAVALLAGAGVILSFVAKGLLEHRRQQQQLPVAPVESDGVKESSG
jgi:uncharacterized membrane protein YfcA